MRSLLCKAMLCSEIVRECDLTLVKERFKENYLDQDGIPISVVVRYNTKTRLIFSTRVIFLFWEISTDGGNSLNLFQ